MVNIGNITLFFADITHKDLVLPLTIRRDSTEHCTNRVVCILGTL